MTEFRYIDDSHPHPFTIEADFMNPEEIRELLEELLRSFRLFHVDSLFREIESVVEKEKIRERAGRAWETLHSLFGEYEELSNDFLGNEQDGAEESIISTLERWSWGEIARRPGGPNSLRYSVVSDGLEECKDNIDRLTASKSTRDTPVLWPFTKVIRSATLPLL